MATRSKSNESYIVIVKGTDPVAVKEKAEEILTTWKHEWQEAEVDVFNADQEKSEEVVEVLKNFIDAIRTPSLFSSYKIVWCKTKGPGGKGLRNTSVIEMWEQIVDTVSHLYFPNLRILISMISPDERLQITKAILNLGNVVEAVGINPEARGWEDKAVEYVKKLFSAKGKHIDEESAALLVEYCGPDMALLQNEVEKISVYVGTSQKVTNTDIETIVTKTKFTHAFALSEAIGERNLQDAIKALEEELWQSQFDPQRGPVSLVYQLIQKIRTLLLTKVLIEEGLLQRKGNPSEVKSQLERLQTSLKLPSDKRYNPALMHWYTIWRSMFQADRYSMDELLEALEELIIANVKMVTSSTNPEFILKETLIRIILQ